MELLKTILAGSVDLILTDPPYGIMDGMGEDKTSHSKGYATHKWDQRLPTAELFGEVARVLRFNGKCVLFSSEPYSAELISGETGALKFSQRAIWLKTNAANCLNSNRCLCSRTEDILIFSKMHRRSQEMHGCKLREMFLKARDESGLTNPQINKILGNGMASHYFTRGKEFAVPSRKAYEKMKEAGIPLEWEYEELKRIEAKHRRKVIRELSEKYPNTFNLCGAKSKTNVFEYKRDGGSYHPTQKPVALLEDLIKTFSNPGDTVLDFTMGSGSTGVACVNTAREFIGIELDDDFFRVATERIKAAKHADQ